MRVLGTQSLSNLNEIADLTGGTYHFAPRLSDIPGGLKKLSNVITQPYIINLKARSLKADELPHVFEVSVNERDSAGRGQKTFIAVKIPIPRWVRWAAVIAAAVLVILLVVLSIIRRIIKRKNMGITHRRCPDCRNRMKDTWDSCPFCRYMPNIKKKKKKAKKDA
jgi:hypothetical protein